MSIWAIGDLHLALGTLGKSMEKFGPRWEGYVEKIESQWRARIQGEDLVLIPGDISWAVRPEEALPDLLWIDRLPGRKLILEGNHDFWWPSARQLEKLLPSSIGFIQRNAILWHGVGIAGSRLWDSEECSFLEEIEWQGSPEERPLQQRLRDEQIFMRELDRLRQSLAQLKGEAQLRIAMTHYPPIGPRLERTRASLLLEEFGINLCIFGHLHNLKKRDPCLGEHNGVRYYCVAADHLQFAPLCLVP